MSSRRHVNAISIIDVGSVTVEGVVINVREAVFNHFFRSQTYDDVLPCMYDLVFMKCNNTFSLKKIISRQFFYFFLRLDSIFYHV